MREVVVKSPVKGISSFRRARPSGSVALRNKIFVAVVMLSKKKELKFWLSQKGHIYAILQKEKGKQEDMKWKQENSTEILYPQIGTHNHINITHPYMISGYVSPFTSSHLGQTSEKKILRILKETIVSPEETKGNNVSNPICRVNGLSGES